MLKINFNPIKTVSSLAKRGEIKQHFYEGVFIADYSKKDNQKLIEIIHNGIDKIISSGFGLPESIIIDEKIIEKYVGNKLRKCPGFFLPYFKNSLFINPKCSFKPSKNWSTRTKEHPLFHENIHRLHFKKNREINISSIMLNDNDSFLAEKFVSLRAVRYKKEKLDLCEFVAEVGAALTAKLKFPKEIMDIYKKYDGPMPNEKI